MPDVLTCQSLFDIRKSTSCCLFMFFINSRTSFGKLIFVSSLLSGRPKNFAMLCCLLGANFFYALINNSCSSAAHCCNIIVNIQMSLDLNDKVFVFLFSRPQPRLQPQTLIYTHIFSAALLQSLKPKQNSFSVK